MDDDDPLLWMRRQRTRNAIIVIAVAIGLMAVGAWMFVSASGDGVVEIGAARRSRADPRVVGGALALIGAALLAGGAILLRRARTMPVDHIPRARVTDDRSD